MSVRVKWLHGLVATLMLALGSGCADIPTATEPTLRPGVPSAIYQCEDDGGCPDNEVWSVNDACLIDPDEPCHPVEATNYFFDAMVEDVAYSCDPPGCKTYPIGARVQGKMRSLLKDWVKDDPNCNAVRDHMIALMNTNKIRFYSSPDGNWADTHIYGGRESKLYDRVHLFSKLFANNDMELFNTLMHEGFHSYYNDVEDENPDAWAASFAGACYKGSSATPVPLR